MTRPVYTRLLAAGSDPEDRTVSVALGVNESDGIRVDLGLGLVGPLMAALAVEAEKLNAALSEADRVTSASLNATGVWLTQDAQGRPAIVFELANGSPLPIVLAGEDLSSFAAELALLCAKPAGEAN